MHIRLIVGQSDDVFTVADGWDENCIDGNLAGYNLAMDNAVSDYGYRNVREVVTDIDDGMLDELFSTGAVEPERADIALIWRIEDGYIELVDAWDYDTIDENPEQFASDVASATSITRVSSHHLDRSELSGAFAPASIALR